MMFESSGIPCSHIMWAMRLEHIHAFPSSLICKQWLKDAKISLLTSPVPSKTNPYMMKMGHFGALSSCCNKLCELGSKDANNFKFVRDGLLKLTERLQKRLDLGGDPVRHPSGMTDDVKNTNVGQKVHPERRNRKKKLNNAPIVRRLDTVQQHVFC